MIYFRLDQFGEAQAEYRAALVASTIANTARDEKRQRAPFQPKDFMRAEYFHEPEPEEPSDEDLWKRIDTVMRMFGGTNGNPG